MGVGVAEFQAYCHEQEVTLVDELTDPRTIDPYAPDVMEILFWAGHQLRQQREMALADQPFIKEGEEAWPHDTPARILHDLINASFRRYPPPDNVHNFPLNPEQTFTCEYADRAFAMAIERLESGPYFPLPAPYILHMHEDRPLILQKGGAYGVPTGLTLNTTWIDAIQYPAGSIVCVDYPGVKEELQGYSAALRDGLYARPARAITGLGFQRLSAFAVPLDERASLFSHLYEDNPVISKAGNRAARTLQPEDIRLIASYAL